MLALSFATAIVFSFIAISSAVAEELKEIKCDEGCKYTYTLPYKDGSTEVDYRDNGAYLNLVKKEATKDRNFTSCIKHPDTRETLNCVTGQTQAEMDAELNKARKNIALIYQAGIKAANSAAQQKNNSN